MIQNSPTIHMGLPASGTDFKESALDLNSYLIANPTATFFMRLETNAYVRLGFFNQDVLVIDRSLCNSSKPQVYEYEGSFKLYTKSNTIPVDSVFWGTVVGVVRKI